MNMKKYVILCVTIIIIIIAYNYVVYSVGFFIDLNPDKDISYFIKTDNKKIYLKNSDNEYNEFIIKGVALDASIPGHRHTDFKIDELTYLRWFSQIQEMGANTIKINTIMNDTFYNSLYKYNTTHSEPLYLLQSLWVTDYANNSSIDALNSKFKGQLLKDAYDAVDIIHGKKNISTNSVRGSGKYRKDISKWVLGYILGHEWNAKTIAYTNQMQSDKTVYVGDYYYTGENATAFEAMLCEIMDKATEYETKKYKTQRLMSFTNDPSIDPFTYETLVSIQIDKFTTLDANNILKTDKALSGHFASYRLYDYCPEFSKYLSTKQIQQIDSILQTIDSNGPYYGYVDLLNKYHNLPVVITGYGYSSARSSQYYGITVNHGLTETEQGNLLASTYQGIINSGSSGAVISTWQDVWTNNTSNTLHAVDLNKSEEWSDYQTADNSFGLLSFDPGKEKSVCYVDGDIQEWTTKDIIIDNDDMSLSYKHDEKFMYFMIYKKYYDINYDVLYIPFDITPKTGSTYCENFDISFERDVDFVLRIDGTNNTRLFVQERYDSFRESSLYKVEKIDPFTHVPDKSSSLFNKIYLLSTDTSIDEDIIKELEKFNDMENADVVIEKKVGKFETGLMTYGNANPDSKDYNSLADFIVNGDYIEIRIPWLLLNFSAPSRCYIHDDYYENYGVENLKIQQIYVGLAKKSPTMKPISMQPIKLTAWGKQLTYHERLKQSYYIIKNLWLNNN